MAEKALRSDDPRRRAMTPRYEDWRVVDRHRLLRGYVCLAHHPQNTKALDDVANDQETNADVVINLHVEEPTYVVDHKTNETEYAYDKVEDTPEVVPILTATINDHICNCLHCDEQSYQGFG